MRYHASIIIFFSFVMTSCASKQLSSTFIQKIDGTNLSELTTASAIQIFGQPDVRALTNNDSSIEAFVYLDKQDLRAPEGTLLFDVKNGKLIEANWFANESNKFDISLIKKRYPSSILDGQPETVKKGLYGQTLLKLHSKNTPLIVFLHPHTKDVSSLSWRFSDKAFIERKPTSH